MGPYYFADNRNSSEVPAVHAEFLRILFKNFDMHPLCHAFDTA